MMYLLSMSLQEKTLTCHFKKIQKIVTFFGAKSKIICIKLFCTFYKTLNEIIKIRLIAQP